MTIDDTGDRDENPGQRRRKKPARAPRAPREPRAPRPLDAAQLQDMAIGYAAKYATTAAKLRRYLQRKLGERGWHGVDSAGAETLPDVDALVARITSLGYVDDRAYAASKARDLTARGFGARRVRGALAAAGVGRDEISAALDPVADDDPADPADPAEAAAAAALGTAIAFARRRRFGPFGRDGASTDPARMRRELAAMARAGHDFAIARRVLGAADADAALGLGDD